MALKPLIAGMSQSPAAFNTAAPGAIGGTTPAAGTFTQVTIDTSTLTSSAQQLIIKSANTLFVRGDSGSTNSILFGTQAGNFWALRSAGHLRPDLDITYDIGDATNRVRSVYIGTTLNLPGGATAFTTSAALTDVSGASAGTLTNAPSVGNPTKWIAINDNGTTRKIPTWT